MLFVLENNKLGRRKTYFILTTLGGEESYRGLTVDEFNRVYEKAKNESKGGDSRFITPLRYSICR